MGRLRIRHNTTGPHYGMHFPSKKAQELFLIITQPRVRTDTGLLGDTLEEHFQSLVEAEYLMLQAERNQDWEEGASWFLPNPHIESRNRSVTGMLPEYSPERSGASMGRKPRVNAYKMKALVSGD